MNVLGQILQNFFIVKPQMGQMNVCPWQAFLAFVKFWQVMAGAFSSIG
jgi:hypothetical protein